MAECLEFYLLDMMFEETRTEARETMISTFESVLGRNTKNTAVISSIAVGKVEGECKIAVMLPLQNGGCSKLIFSRHTASVSYT